MKRIGIIGYGAIGSSIARRVIQGNAVRLAAVCVRGSQREMAEAECGGALVTSTVSELLAQDLDEVVEAAGHEAIKESGALVLGHGCDLHLLSTGALADVTLLEELRAAAAAGSARIKISAGALAGFRGLLALRAGGLTSVRYTASKPSNAWHGTVAAAQFDLERLSEAQVIFEGNAAEAARVFPANANLAAAVALAGVGFERTHVTLIADPQAKVNAGQVEAVSPYGTMTLIMKGPAFENNPKTSQVTALSVVAALEAGSDIMCFA
ncbi:aspartate dehydrogenase [Sphingosinicella rhizophila]|uniref:L-aspartate dehydrogenase n=1 Tax=Sphingosinicella rhizophila TaxID=3050082 RepID=A0ABU3Q5U6_9SPHN|nr:aspartate dehydrogenase [Sphingosinicella sp. GR2756]MDT9598677.1 aspartate dehydrogenase [Sphingosinicella sp. GR2756]